VQKLLREMDNTPETLKTEEMRQLMNILQRFSEKQANYLLYQSHLEAVSKKNTYIDDIEEMIKSLEEVIKEMEQEIKEKEDAKKRMEQEIKEKEDAKKRMEKSKEKLNKLLLGLKEEGI